MTIFMVGGSDVERVMVLAPARLTCENIEG